MPRTRMYFRLLWRSAMLRRARTATALLALTVASALMTAILTLHVDIKAKLAGEFQRYGANVVVKTNNGSGFTAGEINAVLAATPAGTIAAPLAFAVASTQAGTPVVVAGADFASLQRLNSFWKIDHWPSGDTVLVGSRAAAALGERPTLVFGERQFPVTSAVTFTSGGPDDDRIFIPLNDFARWTGIQPTTLELAVPGDAGAIHDAVHRLTQMPGLDVQPVRQIVQGEVRVFSRTQSLVLYTTVAIAIIVILCVVATLTASVLERRRDFAVMKALGSSNISISVLFAGESLLIAFVAALIGWLAGAAIAQLIGRINFHTTVSLRPVTIAPAIGSTILLALLALAGPLSYLNRLQPANMLKGE